MFRIFSQHAFNKSFPASGIILSYKHPDSVRMEKVKLVISAAPREKVYNQINL